MSLTGGASLPGRGAADARARPLRAWSAADRARVAAAIHAATREWRQAWGVDGEGEASGSASATNAEAVRCEPALDARGGGSSTATGWRPLEGAVPGLWWAVTPAAAYPGGPGAVRRAAPAAALARALFGEPGGFAGARVEGDPSASIAEEVAAAAWAELCERLSRALGAADGSVTPRQDADPVEQLRRWSGALAVTFPWCGASMSVLIAGERVDRFLRVAQPAPALAGGLTPLWRALATRTARIRVQLQPFELDLAAIASLRVGDVLRTAHTLDTALPVNVEGADRASPAPACAAFLGKSGRMRAVELIPAPANEARSAEPSV